MRLLLISDTHGKLGVVNDLAASAQADAVIHAGMATWTGVTANGVEGCDYIWQDDTDTSADVEVRGCDSILGSG